MRNKLHFCICALLFLFFSASVRSQTSIPASGFVSENFNSMAGGLNLPANWKVTAAGDATVSWADGTNTTTVTQAANSGTPATGGSYNWGTTAGTDRAVGMMTNGYASPNSVLAYYRNTTGATITSLTVTFQIERYRINTATFNLSFFSSTDGSTWTPRTAGDISAAVFATGASAYNFGTPLTVYKSVTITGLSIANNGDIYFRWAFATPGSSNSQGLGLDNVTVNADTQDPVVTATLTDGVSTPVLQGAPLTYTATINNKGKDATAVQYNATLDPNTTLNGGIQTSALCINDSYATPLNTALIVPAGTGVLTNDFGLPAPTVVNFGNTENPSANLAGASGTSDNGGTVVVNADGSFTYTPPTGFIGNDRFAYVGHAGVSPDDVGIVTIAVGSVVSTGTAESFPGVIGNVAVNNAPSLTSNDAGDGLGIAAVSGNAVGSFPFSTTSTNGGNVTMNANGTFVYSPPPGYEGADNFTYTLDNGFSSPQTVTVSITIAGMIWFINNNAGGGGDGRLLTPFNSISAYTSFAGSNPPAANDYIFVYESATAYTTAALTLLQNQKLIGQDATATIQAITGYTVPAYSAALPGNNTTAPTVNLSNSATIVALSTSGGNIIRGMTISPSGGSGISLSGVASGNHTVSEVIISASSLATGVNIQATSYTGTFDYTSGSIAHTGTGTSFNVTSNSATINCSVPITQSGAGSMVAVVNHTTGTITFQTAILNATNGNGLQFNNADGTYNFNGTTTLNGGDAGIDIIGGSIGTFSFNSNTSITRANSVSGNAFTLANSNANVTYSGSLALGTATGNLVDIDNHDAGTITFQTGNLIRGGSSTTNGISIANSGGGTINFNNPTITIGATSGNGISLTGANTGGTMNFTPAAGGSGIDITTTTGVAFNSTGGGTINVTGSDNTLSSTTGSALNIGTTATTIGGSGITFQSVSANGAINGVNLTSISGGAITLNGGSITGGAGSAFNVNGGNNNITYAGSISQAAAGRAIEIQNKTGGTVLFSGTVSGSGSNTGINLATNTGAIINFTNVITLDGTATGFAATGGGTISITAAGNTIGNTTPPTSGNALNIANTTIGSSGVSFQKISSSTNAVGIILSNTGNSGGGFTIAGTGTTAGTGGTINQSSAGAADGSLTAGIGIYLNSTNNVSLKNMNFTGTFGNFGIRGFTVNNFSLLESNFTGVFGTNNAGGFVESAIHFGTQGGDGTGNGLTGTAVFTGNTIGGGFTDNVGIFNNNTGSLNISFADGTNPAIFNHNGNSGNDGILVESRGNGGATGAGFNLTFSATGVEFRGARGDNIQVAASSNATNNVTILNNTFHNTHPVIVSGGGGIAVVGSGTNMTTNYNVEGNSFRGAKSSPIHIAFGGFSGNARGTVLNNTIGVDDPDRPQASTAQATTGASDNGNGINMYNDKGLNAGFLTHATRIEGNTIRDVTGIPIYIRSNAPTTAPALAGGTRVEATIINNTVEEVRGVPVTLGGTFSSLYCIVGGGGIPDVGKMGLVIKNNTFHQDNTSGTDGDHNAITLDQAAAESYIYLPGYTGGASDHMAVSNFLANIPNSNVMTNGQQDLSGVGAKVYVNALLKNEPLVLLPVPLYAAYSPTTVNNTINRVSQFEVDILLKAALRRFEKNGATKEEMEKLRKATVIVGELPVLFLASSDLGTIMIDSDAAGFGWFIDETPDDDAEFNGDKPVLDKATGKMDLLTVIMHELGHQIGLGDDITNEKHAHLMEGTLKPGERHLPDVKLENLSNDVRKSLK